MISVLGWYGMNNCGDEAFKLAIEMLFSNEKISYETGGVASAEKLVLGGGDVIKDYYLNHIPNDKEFYCLGVGLGYESEIDLLSKKNLVEGFFRNHADVEIARRQEINAHYAPDLAFLLKPFPHEPITKSVNGKKKMGIFLSDAVNLSRATQDFNALKETFYAEYFKWELAQALDSLMPWYDLYFVPFSNEYYSHDLKIHWEVVDRLQELDKEGLHLVQEAYSPQKMINFISELDLVVTMKFHGVIFSAVAETPFINIGLTRKTQLFCEEQNLVNLSVPRFSFEKDRFLSTVKIAESNEIKENLRCVNKRSKEIWKSVEEHIWSSWF